MKKSRDLKQAFERLLTKKEEFFEKKIFKGIERREIVRLIHQVNRLTDKVEKYINIVEFEARK
ncbi:MAG: hypothetical protein U9O98_01350 [Asgard group archaeon]|nr:hypothetical protein [Asgard group archaeon]